MNAPALSSRGISKSFTTGRVTQQVIKDSSLDIFSGELTLVVGPSGSGKSTLLSILGGLLRPDSGHVLSMGVELWTLTEAEIDRFRLNHCGFIFQGFNLFSSLTALENVVLPLQYFGVRGTVAERRARQALDEVGLTRHLHSRPIELSGGEKQRVAIARALVKEPTLIFADEPTSALDKANGQITINLLQRIAHEHQAMVLGVTHDARLLSHADRIIELEDGYVKSDRRTKPNAGTAVEEPPHVSD